MYDNVNSIVNSILTNKLIWAPISSIADSLFTFKLEI